MFDVWLIAGIVVKTGLYLGVLGAVGTVLCALVFGLSGLRRHMFGFAVLGLGAAAGSFMLKGVALTGDVSGLIDPEMLALLWQTGNGTALALQGGGLLMVCLAIAVGRTALALLGGLLALSSFVAVGHVASRDSGALQAVLMLHLLGGAFWIGVLTPLRRLARAQDMQAAADLGHRFGRVAVWSVGGLILAGGVMSYVLAGSVAALVGTGYGQALMMKVAVVPVLLGLAALNKRRFVPALARGEVTAAWHLARSITFEWIAFAAILVMTALLTTALNLPM